MTSPLFAPPPAAPTYALPPVLQGAPPAAYATTPARRVRATGHPIILTDGQTVQVRYGMASIVELEDRFGSLGGVQDAMASLNAGSKVFGSMMDLLACGLLYAGLIPTQPGELPTVGQVRAVLLGRDLVDPADLKDYMEALGRAFTEAFPDPGSAEGKAPTTAPATPPAPGPIGGTTPPPSSDAPPQSSGA